MFGCDSSYKCIYDIGKVAVVFSESEFDLTENIWKLWYADITKYDNTCYTV